MFPKTCNYCGVSYDRAAWDALPYKGVQVIPADEHGPAEILEYKDCHCVNTMAISTPVEAVK